MLFLNSAAVTELVRIKAKISHEVSSKEKGQDFSWPVMVFSGD